MKYLRSIFSFLFVPGQSFKATRFNILALCGAVISLVTTVYGIASDAGAMNITVNFLSFVLSVSLLIFTAKTGKYTIGYVVTIVAVFPIMFPMIFFTAGGFVSGMPCFFVFAVVFTVYMLDGAGGVILAVLELAVYIACCVAALKWPETVTWYMGQKDVMVDVIVGFTASSAALGATMLIQFGMYAKQQKKAEDALNEAELQSRAKGLFLANMSHEIRTPINIILATSEMIGRYSADERVLELNKSIETSGEYLLSIISNVLDITKIESGKVDIENTEYSLNSLVSEQELLGQDLATRKSLSFKIVRNYDRDIVLCGDKNHIRQIATNLISNAIKYTEKGLVSVTFSVEDIDKTNCRLRFSVTDTGIGIRQEDIEGIFDSFNRADFAMHNSVEGTGLGLAIVKQLTNALGGEISVTSELGKGSCFSVYLPQTISSTGHIVQKEVEFREFVASKARILAVDDKEENLQILKLLLEKLLIDVDTALCGREGIELAKKNDYDIIILDCVYTRLVV